MLALASFLISIRAPREGSDAGWLRVINAYETFLSALPARGATGTTVTIQLAIDISIRAPREGSDTCN